MTGTVDFRRDGMVGHITLNRPEKLNAVSREMARVLETIVAECNEDSTIRAVVLSGAGTRAFCAGTDVSQLDQFGDEAWAFRNREDYCKSVRQIVKPVVCAINGYALGGGLEMALSCDVRLAADTARLGAPEIKLGWIGGGGMATMLCRSAGSSNAALMLMTGDPIDAITAKDWQLVSEVLPSAALLDRAGEIATIIASRAPIAAEHAKINLANAANMPAILATQYELDLQAICFATRDAAEGRRAFAEKRTPRFDRR
ncbi:enoyl-CoA hydratase/isomerase family protein [Sphingomonas sp. 1P08PE]|uniref:enoyl-CoA hydratase/isomerase family protein n=1 Tax=Sphingomonas sp. 1P08PE TaxID=554122 RepID=UPI0039A3DC92